MKIAEKLRRMHLVVISYPHILNITYLESISILAGMKHINLTFTPSFS
jgi:hypothetical protein